MDNISLAGFSLDNHYSNQKLRGRIHTYFQMSAYTLKRALYIDTIETSPLKFCLNHWLSFLTELGGF